ncbi:type IV secretory system conjugative DNA transfer family protein [Streptomyces yerevanensis]|uniref:type IV secretory system conjugative DNA transfer family protein n=1 Tax=Streptomyces yerevanensis TaxID=66378 RepID=UPI000996A3EE|nr:type IV secretory system conjugative DNA transfer family protein [Streptomyces yerevanensis]
MRPYERGREHERGEGGVPDGLVIGVLAFLLGMTVLVWSATGLAGLFDHGSWPSKVTFGRTPLAMRHLIQQPHDVAGAWPETPEGQLSGYGLFWGLLIGQLMVLVVLTVFVMGTVARWRAVRAARRHKAAAYGSELRPGDTATAGSGAASGDGGLPPGGAYGPGDGGLPGGQPGSVPAPGAAYGSGVQHGDSGLPPGGVPGSGREPGGAYGSEARPGGEAGPDGRPWAGSGLPPGADADTGSGFPAGGATVPGFPPSAGTEVPSAGATGSGQPFSADSGAGYPAGDAAGSGLPPAAGSGSGHPSSTGSAPALRPATASGPAYPHTPTPPTAPFLPGGPTGPAAEPPSGAAPYAADSKRAGGWEKPPIPNPRSPVVVLGPPQTRHPLATEAVRDAEGPALVITSNPTLWSDTKDARAKLGPVLLYDPSHLCDTPARLHWSPSTGCQDKDTARARAAALLAPVRPTAKMDQAVADVAETLLRSYLHAAAADGRTIRHLHRWAQGTGVQEAVRILRTNPKAASGSAGELEAALTSYPERRDIAQELTARALSSLFTVNVREACTPNRTDALTLDSFVNEGGTLYVVGEPIEDPKTNPSAMPLLTALASSVVERGRRMAERSSSGRLDPPLTLVLDDVAAVAPLPQLPDLLTTGADRGMPTLALLRSREQARTRWPNQELPA